MKKISVIVPCFNEEAVLPQLFARLGAVAVTWDADHEIICVDDGSRDRTWEILKAQHARDSRWRCLCFARNFGHQTAVSAGLHYATGDAVVVIDADLQDPPEEISRLLAKWQEGFEVVFATRKKRQDPLVKKFLAWGFYRLLQKLTPLPMSADAGDFCLLDQKVVAVMNALPERNRYLRGLRIFSFSTMPLRVATWLGLVVSAGAFLGAVFTFCEKIFAEEFAKFGFTPGPHGIPTLVISILFLGGVQLICLGILGEYIGRIYEEVKGRPHWVIRDEAGLNAETVSK